MAAQNSAVETPTIGIFNGNNIITVLFIYSYFSMHFCRTVSSFHRLPYELPNGSSYGVSIQLHMHFMPG